jgi:dUTP pyrophosphatase
MNIELIYTSREAVLAYENIDAADNLGLADGPRYSSEHAAAFDLRAMIADPITILPGEQYMIPTGIKLNMRHAEQFLPLGVKLAAVIMPRSGRGSKEGLCIANTVGLIDEDYQGEITFCAWARPTNGHVNSANHRLGGTPIHIEPGERIGQLMFVYAPRPNFSVVESFSTTTERGEGGYGSTGTK